MLASLHILTEEQKNKNVKTGKMHLKKRMNEH
jgi:hypothetical protein